MYCMIRATMWGHTESLTLSNSAAKGKSGSNALDANVASIISNKFSCMELEIQQLKAENKQLRRDMHSIVKLLDDRDKLNKLKEKKLINDHRRYASDGNVEERKLVRGNSEYYHQRMSSIEKRLRSPADGIESPDNMRFSDVDNASPLVEDGLNNAVNRNANAVFKENELLMQQLQSLQADMQSVVQNLNEVKQQQYQQHLKMQVHHDAIQTVFANNTNNEEEYSQQYTEEQVRQQQLSNDGQNQRDIIDNRYQELYKSAYDEYEPNNESANVDINQYPSDGMRENSNNNQQRQQLRRNPNEFDNRHVSHATESLQTFVNVVNATKAHATKAVNAIHRQIESMPPSSKQNGTNGNNYNTADNHQIASQTGNNEAEEENDQLSQLSPRGSGENYGNIASNRVSYTRTTSPLSTRIVNRQTERVLGYTAGALDGNASVSSSSTFGSRRVENNMGGGVQNVRTGDGSLAIAMASRPIGQRPPQIITRPPPVNTGSSNNSVRSLVPNSNVSVLSASTASVVSTKKNVTVHSIPNSPRKTTGSMGGNTQEKLRSMNISTPYGNSTSNVHTPASAMSTWVEKKTPFVQSIPISTPGLRSTTPSRYIIGNTRERDRSTSPTSTIRTTTTNNTLSNANRSNYTSMSSLQNRNISNTVVNNQDVCNVYSCDYLLQYDDILYVLVYMHI